MEQKRVQRRNHSPKPTTKKKTKTTAKRASKGKKSNPKWTRWIYVSLLAVFFILIVFLFVGKKGHKGIDVSHHQGNIQWEQVASENVEFAYIKATEGVNYVDKLYKHNLSEARNHGILVGPYHFFRADKSGKEQFEHFKSIIDKEFDLIPVLDLEELGGKISDKAKYRSEVKSFVDSFESFYGYKPFVYGSYSFMKDFVYPVAEDCDYWLAWYSPLAKAIRDKRRFLNKVRPGLHARMWQYSDKGKINGITGDVDLDECWEIEDLKVKKNNDQ